MADPGSGEGTEKGNAAYAEGKYEDAVSHWKQSYKSIASARFDYSKYCMFNQIIFHFLNCYAGPGFVLTVALVTAHN